MKSTAYPVPITFRLDAFEGPLDLLLHLIDINKIDIYDIPISLITDQYLEYIGSMGTEDMDIASDFLVMAATLLRIKSQMLLPADEKEKEEDEKDPRSELVSRLLEYKTFKYIAQELKGMEEEAGLSFFKGMTIPDDMEYTAARADPAVLAGDTDIEELKRIYDSLMKKKRDNTDPVRSGFGRIEQEPRKVTDKITYIKAVLSGRKERISFRRLLENDHERDDIIVTFLAVLELMKDGSITAAQDHLFDDIFIIEN